MALPNSLERLRISLDEIRSATNNFDDSHFIGSGGFGKVYKGEVSESMGVVAIKRLDATSKQGTREFLTEIAMLSGYKHENLISLAGFCDDGNEKVLVYEFATNGSLDKYLNNYTSLGWLKRLKICLGAARGLNYLHHDVGAQHRVIHRDIKSGNILLDQNWEAKIADFGLSKIGPANQQITFLVSNVAGTFGYLDPLYYRTGMLTKESDVFSFGVVLFEVLCGRLACVDAYNDKRRFLFHLARSCFEEGNLDDIIEPDLRKQMDVNSLSSFASIAYKCLQEKREERPTMALVVENLQTALEIQETYESRKEKKLASQSILDSETDIFWEQKLPPDYERIFTKLNISRNYDSKKELYSLLQGGILFDEGRRLFSIDTNGQKCEMIAARFLKSNLFVQDLWGDSRFSKVLESRNPLKINLRIRITTEMLSVGTMYAANLVFRYRNMDRYSKRAEELKCKFDTESVSSHLVHPQWVDDKWMKIEMWHFLCNRRDSEFNVVLEGMSDYTGSGILIDGIEFRPLETIEDEGTENLEDKLDDLTISGQDTDWEEKLPSDYQELIHVEHDTPKKQVYLLLCRGILIDDGKKWLSILDGKKCTLLSAMEVIDASDHEHWDWKSLSESRFSQVAELQKREKFAIKFRTKAQQLSPNTDYKYFLVYKLAQNYHGLEGSLKVSVVGEESESYIHFVSRSPLVKPKNSLTSQTTLTNYRPKFKGLQIQRKDGWMEIDILPGYYFTSNLEGDDEDISRHFEVSKLGVNMSGLIIEGIELRPYYP